MPPQPLTTGESYVLPDGRRGHLLEIRESEGEAVFGIEELSLGSGFMPSTELRATDERVIIALSQAATLYRMTQNSLWDGIKYAG